MDVRTELSFLTEESIERLTNIHEIFRFCGMDSKTGEIYRRTLSTDDLPPHKKERAQEIEEIMQSWVHEIYTKHGFQQKEFISDMRWRQYISYIYSGYNPNTLPHDDLLLYLIWKGKEESVEKILTKSRKHTIFSRSLNVHGRTEKEMRDMMSSKTFEDLIFEELKKTRVDNPSPEIVGLAETVCEQKSGCEVCVRKGVTMGSYLNQELSLLQ